MTEAEIKALLLQVFQGRPITADDIELLESVFGKQEPILLVGLPDQTSQEKN